MFVRVCRPFIWLLALLGAKRNQFPEDRKRKTILDFFKTSIVLSDWNVAEFILLLYIDVFHFPPGWMLFCRVLVGQTRCNITIHLIEYGIRHKNTILFPYFPHIFSVACFFCAAVFALYSGDKREIRKDIISRCLCEYIRPQGPLPQILFLSLSRRHEYFFHSSTFISRNKKKGMAQRPLCTHKFPNRSPSPPAKSAPTIGRVKPNRASSSLFCCCVLSNEIQSPTGPGSILFPGRTT